MNGMIRSVDDLICQRPDLRHIRHPARHVLFDLKQGERTIAQLLEAPVDGFEQVVGFVLLNHHVGVADDAEQVRAFDVCARKQLLDVAADHIFEKHIGRASVRREVFGNRNEPGQHPRHFYARELGAAAVPDAHRQIHAQVRDVRKRMPRIECQRRPDFHVRAGRKLERRRHHADDDIRHRVELNRLPNHRWICAERPAPEAVAQHHDAVGPDHALITRESPPERGVRLQHVEQIRRRTQPWHVLRIAGALVGEVDVPIRCHRLERLCLTLPVVERRNRHRPLIALRIDLPQDRNLLRLLIRQRVQHHGLDDAEDRGVGADAERQRQQ